MILSQVLSHKNVIHKVVSKNNVPRVIHSFDICIIPYDIRQKFNLFSFPMKVMEYFYMKKPIISSNILDLKLYNKYIMIADTYPEWNFIINSILNGKLSKSTLLEAREISIRNSWTNKLASICEYVDKHIST